MTTAFGLWLGQQVPRRDQVGRLARSSKRTASGFARRASSPTIAPRPPCGRASPSRVHLSQSSPRWMRPSASGEPSHDPPPVVVHDVRALAPEPAVHVLWAVALLPPRRLPDH